MTRLITVREAAENFKIHHATIKRWLCEGKINGIRAGQGGYAARSNATGRLQYHTLVDYFDCARMALRYYERAASGSKPGPKSARTQFTCRHDTYPRATRVPYIKPDVFRAAIEAEFKAANVTL